MSLSVHDAQQVGLVGLKRAAIGNGTEQVIILVFEFSLDGCVICAAIVQLVCTETLWQFYLIGQQHGEAILAVLAAPKVAVGPTS